MKEPVLKGNRPLRLCFKCKQEKVPEGGVDVGPGKWKCAECWRGVHNRRTGAWR